jgi:hypothetical protein
MTSRKNTRSAAFVALASICLSGVTGLTSAHASEVTSVMSVPDGIHNVNYVFNLTHPSEIACDWGTGDPENGTTCSFELKYSVNWVENRTTGIGTKNGVMDSNWSPMLPLSDFLSPTRSQLRILDGTTNVLDSWTYISMYGERNSVQTKTISFKFNGPTTLTFGIADGVLSEYNKPISVSGSGIKVTGLTKQEATAAYNAIKAKAAADAKAASDAQAAASAQAAKEKAASDKAALASKLLSITCKNGTKSKVVRGENPTCPKGYKNPMAPYLTFQAFQKCKLFKKDNLLVNASLLDGGKTLDFNSVGKYQYSTQYNFATYADLVCALGVLQTPSFVTSQINSTRALDGIQKATWGKISAFWTYHPDNGVNITFNQS